MRRPASRLLLAAAGIVLVASLVVHVLTYVPCVRVSMAWAWSLHAAVLAVGVGALLCGLPRPENRRRPTGVGVLDWQRREYRRSRDLFRRFVGLTPVPVRWVVVVTLLASVVNFYRSTRLLEHGVPAAAGGRYYLHHHGTKIRDLTETEYHRFEAYQVRLFSSAWVVLALVAVVAARYVAPRKRELMEQAEETGGSVETGEA